MKKIYLFICVLIALLFQAPQVMAGKQSYPMVCKGGGSMQVKVLNARHATVYISFRKSRNPASRIPPGPGECAWLDRAVSAQEPSEMYISGNANPFTYIIVDRSGPRFTYSKDSRVALLKAAQQGQIFHVRAQTTQYGLKVTKLGP